MSSPPIVSLLTDFGLADAYVGVMKGVILAACPQCRLVDLTHEVPPQAVVTGAYLLESAWRYFPAGTIHLAVVDPGVGTSRRRLALAAGGHILVGPDNGLLSAALPDAIRGPRRPGEAYSPRLLPLPAGVEGVAIEPGPGPVSATFEGRDVFARAAARLAAGESLAGIGAAVRDAFAMPAFRAPQAADGRVHGLILHADRFGNLLTDIDAASLPSRPIFRAGGREFRPAPTYGDAPGLAAIVSSNGRIEIAVPNGSAAAETGLRPGDAVLVEAAG